MIQIQKNVLKIALVLTFTAALVAPAAMTSVVNALPSQNIAKTIDSGGSTKTSKKSSKKKKSGTTDTRTTDPALNKDVCTQKKCPIIHTYVNGAIAALSALVGVVAVIAIVAGGIQYATAGGDPQKSAAGQKHIRNAILGLIAFIFFLAFMNFIIPGGIT